MTQGINMRPDFIPSDVFRAYLTGGQINKWVRIGGIMAYSFLQRCEQKGRPIKHVMNKGSKHWRLLDVVARARADGLLVEAPLELRIDKEMDRLAQTNKELVEQLENLREESAVLSHVLALNKASVKLTGATLLKQREIVAAKMELPVKSGVYFLINNGKVVYVGQSVKIMSRVIDHTINKVFDGFAYIPCEANMLDVMESLYIHVLRPPLNGKRFDGKSPVAPLQLKDLFAAANQTNRLERRA